jgi:hypothetical protein
MDARAAAMLAATETSTPVPVSRKRWLLAIYLDYLVVGAVFTLAGHFVAPGRDLTIAVHLMFVIVEVLLVRVVKWSPGEFLMSISVPPSSGHRPVVDRRVWANEAALTVLLGVLFVSGGSKALVRWTMWAPPTPFFGLLPGKEEGIALQVVEGLLALVVAALVLRLHASAPAAVAALSTATIVSVVLSWPLWDGYVERYVHARRSYQGLPVRSGEVDFMRRFMPFGVIAFAVAEAAVVLVYRGRFVRPDRGAVPERREA